MVKDILKKGIYIGLLLFLMCTFLGCNEGRDTYKEASEYAARGLYETAVDLYRRAISQGEDSAIVYADLALSYKHIGNQEESSRMMDVALTKSPDDPDVLLRKALCIEIDGSREETEEAFKKAISSYEDSKKVNAAIGFYAAFLYDTGRFEESITLYNQLIRADYAVSEHQLLAGRSYLSLHQFEAASLYFDLALKGDSVSAEKYLFLYDICRETEYFSGSERYFSEGLTYLKDHPKDPCSVGMYYAKAGKYDAAIRYLTEENKEESIIELITCYQKTGKTEEAISLCEKTISKGQASGNIYLKYALLRLSEGNVSSAKQLLSKVATYKDSELLEKADIVSILIAEREGDFTGAYRRLLEFEKKSALSPKLRREKLFLETILSGQEGT